MQKEKKFIGRGLGSTHEKARRMVCGVGINDSPTSTGNGKQREKSYSIWKSILNRCYGKLNKKHRTYMNCSVCEEWKKYSNFKKWFDKHKKEYGENYHIDKDILVRKNKVYSPDACCFVPPEINTLLVKHDSTRGILPIGVAKTSDGKKYRAIVRIHSKYTTIGIFNNPEEAFLAYKAEKEKHIQEMATKYYNDSKITKRVYDALMKYRVEITD